MKIRVPSYIDRIKKYVPGKPVEELERELGISGAVKLASNENSLGPSPLAVAAAKKAMDSIHRYPDGACFELSAHLCKRHGLVPENMIFGNGSDDILFMASKALLQQGDEAIIPYPSFLMYEVVTRSSGAVPVFAPLDRFMIDTEAILSRITDRTRMIFICNPNNPTGTILKKKSFERFLGRIPEGVTLVIDEAYGEFVMEPESVRGKDYLAADVPVIVLRTFSKAYGLAGIRIGYGMVSEALWEVLNRVREPFNVSIPAQAAAVAALEDDAFLKKTLESVRAGLDYLYTEIERLGLKYVPTQANFFMIDVKTDADMVFEMLLKQGVIVRSMKSYGYDTHIRVTVGLHEENKRFVEALSNALKEAGIQS